MANPVGSSFFNWESLLTMDVSNPDLDTLSNNGEMVVESVSAVESNNVWGDQNDEEDEEIGVRMVSNPHLDSLSLNGEVAVESVSDDETSSIWGDQNDEGIEFSDDEINNVWQMARSRVEAADRRRRNADPRRQNEEAERIRRWGRNAYENLSSFQSNVSASEPASSLRLPSHLREAVSIQVRADIARTETEEKVETISITQILERLPELESR